MEGSSALREYGISAGKLQIGGKGRRDIADYVLESYVMVMQRIDGLTAVSC